MKYLSKTIHYISRSNEEVGIFTEKIICDILKIPFKSKRQYITSKEYPLELKKDIQINLKNVFKSLEISEHCGNQNDYYDFKTKELETVSIKTNISNNKICPQNIGQVSLHKFSEKTGIYLNSIIEFKQLIFDDTFKIINLYLDTLFLCSQTLVFKYDKGVVYNLEKKGKVQLNINSFSFSRKLNDWKQSISVSINVNNGLKPLCEIQTHNSRDCVQCRFNLDTIIYLIDFKVINNLDYTYYRLDNKYNIKVSKF